MAAYTRRGWYRSSRAAAIPMSQEPSASPPMNAARTVATANEVAPNTSSRERTQATS